MAQKIKYLVLLGLLALLVLPVLAQVGDPGSPTAGNITLFEHIYQRSTFAIPDYIWMMVFLLGCFFLSEGLRFASKCTCPSPDATIICGIVSGILFLASSFMVPLMSQEQMFSYPGPTLGSTTNIAFNMIVTYGQSYLMWFCWIMAGVAILVMAYGIQKRAQFLRDERDLVPEDEKEFL